MNGFKRWLRRRILYWSLYSAFMIVVLVRNVAYFLANIHRHSEGFAALSFVSAMVALAVIGLAARVIDEQYEVLHMAECLRPFACPDCGSLDFYAGPRGGNAVNIRCVRCGAKLNYSPPFPIERIDNENTSYHYGERIRLGSGFIPI